MSSPSILVAGIGNIFLGDDAFGVEVVRRLAGRPLPEGVRVMDFGIRGFDLTYALVERWDTAILVDAAPRGERPGTLYIIEPELEPVGSEPSPAAIETHAMDPVKVLRLAVQFGELPRRVLVVGCEPEPLSSQDDMRMSLSPAVASAVDEAVSLVESLIDRFVHHRGTAPPGRSPAMPVRSTESTEKRMVDYSLERMSICRK